MQRRHRRRRVDFDAGFLERASGGGRNFGVFRRQYFRQHFDHRDGAAERAIEARKLDADRAGADDEQALRQCFRHHRLARSPYQVAVGLDAGQRFRAGASGNHDRIGAERLRAVDDDSTGFGESRGAVEYLHLVLLEQTRYASVELLGNGARTRYYAPQIDLRRTRIDAERRRALDLAQHVCRVQQRLRRNAAPVEAHAADLRALDQRRGKPELRGADRGDVAAGTTADDDDVENLFAHGYTSSRYGASSRSRTAPRNCAAGAPSSTR